MAPLKVFIRAAGPTIAVILSLVWAIGYVWSVNTNPWHDENALALIGPLVWILGPIGIYVVFEAFFSASQVEPEETLGLNDWRRQSYLIALAAYLVTLPWLGFLGAGLPFLAVLAWWLGFRRPLCRQMQADEQPC